MKVLTKVLAGVVLSAIATALGVAFYPEAEPVQYVVPLIKYGAVSTIILSAISVYKENELNDFQKNILMNSFLVAILVPSFWAAGAFMHESETSWSGGEIHWHADFEVLTMENGELQRQNLIDPGNFCSETTHESTLMCKLNDRTGATEYHEHNDQRIHLEGTFKDKEDATLAAFFETFYGELSNDRMVYPTNDGTINVTEENGNELKIIINKGTGPNRHWCVIGTNVQLEDVCKSHGWTSDSPSKYIVSPYKKGPSLDDIFIIYDSSSTREALQDLRDDGKYKGFGLKKSGEGYGG